MTGIYKITNILNGKVYIGQSQDINRRWKEHRYRAFQSNAQQYEGYLYRAIRKYGIDNFTFEILEECKIADLDEKEKYYIDLYDSYKNGYNETAGGQGTIGRGKLTDEEVSQIIDLLKNSSILQLDIAKQFNVSKDAITDINLGHFRKRDDIDYPIRKNKNKSKACQKCGKPLTNDSKTGFCLSCLGEQRRKVERPTREELKDLIRSSPFVVIGKQFGVTDGAIRKWCKTENLPYRKRDINAYSDEEWEKL